MEPTPEPVKIPTPVPPREPTPEPVKIATPEPKESEIEPITLVTSESESLKEPTPEPIKIATPEPPKEPTPEPVKIPTPEPPKEPEIEPITLITSETEPPKESTPEPVKFPTPEPEIQPITLITSDTEAPKELTPEPAKIPTPEPPREPTPEPTKETTPELIKEATPDLPKSDSKEDTLELLSNLAEEIIANTEDDKSNLSKDKSSSAEAIPQEFTVKDRNGKNEDTDVEAPMKGAKGLSDFLENSIPANAVVNGNSENRDVKENGSSNGKYDDDVEVIGGIEENTLEKTE